MVNVLHVYAPRARGCACTYQINYCGFQYKEMMCKKHDFQKRIDYEDGLQSFQPNIAIDAVKCNFIFHHRVASER